MMDPDGHSDGCRQQRIVVVTAAGRKHYLELLKFYLLREPSLAEWQLWDNCRTEGDRQYLNELAAADPRVRIVRIPGSDGTNRSVNRFYGECSDPCAFYVKMDDDIVYLPERFLDSLYAQAVRERSRYLWWSPLVVNNAICSWLVKYHSHVSIPERLSCQASDSFGWRDAQFAEKLHRQFLAVAEDDAADPFRVPDFEISLSRFSINCIGFWGKEVVELGKQFCPDDVDDEEWLSACLPARLKKPGRIVGSIVISHFSFFTQEFELLRTDLLGLYYRLAGLPAQPYPLPRRTFKQKIRRIAGRIAG